MRDHLWSSEDVASAMGGELSKSDWHASGVSIDSRTVSKGDLFFAIQGLARDGHVFVESAHKAKAAAVVVSDKEKHSLDLGASVLVEDTLAALEDLGKAARKRVDAKVLAVTGSVGKTGTKEALKMAFGQLGATHASEASYNNLWGVPLSLARMPAATQYGIFEIGMNHPDEIVPLTKMVQPDIAIVTTVALVHLEFFRDEVEIADAKGEIFEGLQRGGTAIINQDMVHFDRLRERALRHGAGRIIGFGVAKEADVRLIDAKLGASGSQVVADVAGHECRYEIGAPGKHWVLNSLAVAAALHAADADVELGLRALKKLKSPKGRGELHSIHLIKGGELTLVDESYNANPVSMKAALQTLASAEPERGGRRIAVLGDMRELGATADVLHADLIGTIGATEIELVFACGPHMAALWEVLPKERRGEYRETSEQLLEPLTSGLKDGDVVMVKGSLGTNMAPIVKAIQALEVAESTTALERT